MDDRKYAILLGLAKFLRIAIVPVLLYVVIFYKPNNVVDAITAGLIIGLAVGAIGCGSMAINRFEANKE
jgi:hypothetical protein